jgi:hypothetical protein
MTEPRSEKANNVARGRRMFEDTHTKEGRIRVRQEKQHGSTGAGRELYDRLHPAKPDPKEQS